MNNLEQEQNELKKRVINYATDVSSGKQLMGEKFIRACDRFLADLEDEHYFMDWEEVLKFNRWSSMFKHTKGELAGQYISLTDWQLFLVANIFGIKQKDNGYRKYKEAYIEVGRKNAKSQLLAMMVSYVAFLSDEQEEIYISCWTRDQSNLVYNETLTQIRAVDMLRDKFSDSYNMIKVLNNQSIIKPLSREARKTGEGTNPSFSVLDEYKDNQTDELKSVQKTGMGARPNRLLIVITTSGSNLDYPCYKDYEYYSDVLNPETDTFNDEIFIAICELDKDDDIKDEKNWIKANPILATYETGIEYLRSGLKLALDQPHLMREYLTKNMNMWVDQKDNGYMSLEKWNKQEVDEEFIKEFLQGSHVYYGIDLSSKIDLSSLGWVAVKEGKFLVGQHSYTPEDMFREKISQDKVRYDLFQENDELTVTEGSVVDYNYLKQDLIELAKQHGAKQVGFDSWNAVEVSLDLQNEGFEMVEVKQSITALTEATKSFREGVYSGKIYHTGDSLLRWSIGNAVTQEDQNGNIKINKAKSKDRIDPVDAIINAYSLAMFDEHVKDLNSIILSDDWSF